MKSLISVELCINLNSDDFTGFFKNKLFNVVQCCTIASDSILNGTDLEMSVEHDLSSNCFCLFEL